MGAGPRLRSPQQAAAGGRQSPAPPPAAPRIPPAAGPQGLTCAHNGLPGLGAGRPQRHQRLAAAEGPALQGGGARGGQRAHSDCQSAMQQPGRRSPHWHGCWAHRLPCCTPPPLRVCDGVPELPGVQQSGWRDGRAPFACASRNTSPREEGRGAPSTAARTPPAVYSAFVVGGASPPRRCKARQPPRHPPAPQQQQPWCWRSPACRPGQVGGLGHAHSGPGWCGPAREPCGTQRRPPPAPAAFAGTQLAVRQPAARPAAAAMAVR